MYLGIEDVKKLLKDYSFKSDLVEDEPEDNLKMYSYTFRNNNMESIRVTNTIQDNKEYISQNTIILPMYREIGDFIEVYYFIDKPTILYKESFNKLFITLVISIICFWAGYSMG